MNNRINEVTNIEGFPKGDLENIKLISNPPQYTAYPNPFIEEFINLYGTPYDESNDVYQRGPYVIDVSEGKNDPLYNAHSYHTKVPYKAIIPFIEHYTQPGDIVFDGFAGTGMTGVAAQKSGRNAILSDLSPIAAFISHNVNSNINLDLFARNVRRIINEVESEIKWMYQTHHKNGKVGDINYVIWSDVFICPYCSGEIVYWNSAIDPDSGESMSTFDCPHCHAQVNKKHLNHAYEHCYDNALKETIKIAKVKPVVINYTVDGKRYTKEPDTNDLSVIKKIEDAEIPYWYPSERMPEGDEARRNDSVGITHTHHYYTKRNLWALSAIYAKIKPENKYEIFWFTSLHSRLHRLNRYMANHNRHVGPLSGTLYISSTPVEINVLNIAADKFQSLVEAGKEAKYSKRAIVTTQSSTDLRNIPDESVDYVFVDPPFGNNLMYSDLNFLLESWIKVFTNNRPEAVISNTHQKDLDKYRDLMVKAFSEMNRILKPGRWITVEFHNSKAAVWNAIQEALSKAGFLVAQVTVIDKQKGTTKQLTYSSAVKNDLVISAYKPQSSFTKRLITSAGRGMEADFVRQHLDQLPLAENAERSKEMLYSKYLAYYVQHGYQVAYNSETFYSALSKWGFVMSDNGFWFADENQLNDFERRKIKTPSKNNNSQQGVLFVSDERSARQWLWDFLSEPKTFDDIYTSFVKALQTPEDAIPEPSIILEEGFIMKNGLWKRPDALSQAELEKKRQERLLRQFDDYLKDAKQGLKLKEVRKEALVAGFTKCYQAGHYSDILLVARKLPKGLLEDSPDLFDFVDIAEAKVEGA